MILIWLNKKDTQNFYFSIRIYEILKEIKSTPLANRKILAQCFKTWLCVAPNEYFDAYFLLCQMCGPYFNQHLLFNLFCKNDWPMKMISWLSKSSSNWLTIWLSWFDTPVIKVPLNEMVLAYRGSTYIDS